MKTNDPTFERTLRKYQRLTMTLFYPPLLSLFSVVSGYLFKDYAYYFSYSFTRFLMLDLVESNRGAYSFAYFVPLLVSLAIAALFVELTLLAAKGKLYPLILGSVLYLGDALYGLLLYGTSLYGQMRLDVYILSLVVHLAFLVLYGFALVNYAKLVRPSGKPRQNP